MTTPINSRRGLRTPLANAARRREADTVAERSLPAGLSEDEVLAGTTSYGRGLGLRRAMQYPGDEPRRPNMMAPEDQNFSAAEARRVRAMKKGGLAKAKPPSRKLTSKATRVAPRNRVRSGPK
jgi:hypothetical protein